MARRRTKKQQRQLEEVIQGAIVIFAFSTYLITKSLTTTAYITIVAIGLVIFIAVRRSSKQKELLRRSGIAEIDKMDGIQFEHYLGELFKKQGYKVVVTSAAGDYGADLVLEKGQNKIVVQAKRYQSIF